MHFFLYIAEARVRQTVAPPLARDVGRKVRTPFPAAMRGSWRAVNDGRDMAGWTKAHVADVHS